MGDNYCIWIYYNKKKTNNNERKIKYVIVICINFIILTTNYLSSQKISNFMIFNKGKIIIKSLFFIVKKF